MSNWCVAVYCILQFNFSVLFFFIIKNTTTTTTTINSAESWSTLNNTPLLKKSGTIPRKE